MFLIHQVVTWSWYSFNASLTLVYLCGNFVTPINKYLRLAELKMISNCSAFLLKNVLTLKVCSVLLVFFFLFIFVSFAFNFTKVKFLFFISVKAILKTVQVYNEKLLESGKSIPFSLSLVLEFHLC